MNTPFEIGQVMWRPRQQSEPVQVKCPVCVGQRYITIILGDGERLFFPCEACSFGIERPTGYVTEYSAKPNAERFEIAGIDSMHDGKWTLKDPAGNRANYETLCDDEETALLVSKKCCAESEEDNARRRCNMRKRAGRASWSIAYHRNQIKDLERQVCWHRSKIEAQKEGEE